MSERNSILCGLAAEVLFTVLPLLLVFGVLFHVHRTGRLFSYPEWSFGAAILFGQALVKFVSGLIRGGTVAIGPVVLALVLIIVLGLAPSLLVLTLTLLSLEPNNTPGLAIWLQIGQVILFLLAAISYMVLGVVGDMYHSRYSKSLTAKI